jgi:hypothetical protein
MRSANITELFDAGFNFARHLPKANAYEGHKSRRKDTTHFLEETKISVVATPLKRWPKHKSSNAGYGKPRYMQVPTTKDNQVEIPTGATHLEYKTSRIAIVDTINHVQDFTHMRGELRFGKYHKTSDRFEYMDESEERKDGTCEVNKARKREEDAEVDRVVREHPELPKPPKFKFGKPQVGVTKPGNVSADAVVIDDISKKTVSQAVVEALAKRPAFQKQPRAPRAAGGESVCGFIDGLIAEGGRTKEEVLALVLAKFPGRDAKATMSTIGVRPSHMRAAGKTPQPFKK